MRRREHPQDDSDNNLINTKDMDDADELLIEVVPQMGITVDQNRSYLDLIKTSGMDSQQQIKFTNALFDVLNIQLV